MHVKLTITAGPHTGKEYVFDGHDTFLVGRSKDAHFQLSYDDPYFSRRQFVIEVNPPRCRILDLKSKNGTRVNGKAFSVSELNDGDEVQAGHTVFKVTVVPPDPDQQPTLSFPPSAKPASPMTQDYIMPGLSIPGYRLACEIGRGGLGVVYRGVREKDNRSVAIKLITPAVGSSQKQIERFLRESQILGKLDHPRIVRFLESGRTKASLFIAMEILSGPDLARFVADRGPLEISTAIRLTCQALAGLNHAHLQGFVHRDIKPGNLVLGGSTGKRFVKVADFGLSRAFDASLLSGLTMQGEVGGTPEFMAPEQITHFRDVKPAGDQYSIAATLYFLMTAQFVFDFPKSTGEKLVKILVDTPVPLQQRRPEIPEALANVVLRGLAREPENRFPDLAAFRAALLPYA